MPFPVGDPRAAIAGRKAMSIRWAKATPEQRSEAGRTMTEAKARQYIEKASTTFERLGVAPTPEQVQQAATALQRADLRERLAAGRAAKAELRAQGDAWVARVHKLAGLFIDGLCRELGLTPDLATTVARVAYSAMADETDRPQEERDFQRLNKRWETYRLWLHEQRCPETRWPDMPCLVCGCSGGVRPVRT